MLLYASSITNLTDARYFAAREVDFLGFNLEAGTPGYLDPIYMKAMREWVEGPRIVGEFSLSAASTVLEAADFFSLDAVCLRGERYLGDLPLFEGRTLLLEIEPGTGLAATGQIFSQAAPWVKWFVLHFSGTSTADAPGWKALFERYPILLQPEVSLDSLPLLVADYQPAGLLLRGGAEEQVGVKSFEEIEAIFEALDED
ncbi:MAG: hypothetical protein U0U46_10530 [Saprospiraceae bacterium]